MFIRTKFSTFFHNRILLSIMHLYLSKFLEITRFAIMILLKLLHMPVSFIYFKDSISNFVETNGEI